MFKNVCKNSNTVPVQKKLFMHVINQGVTRSFLDEKKNSENFNIQFFLSIVANNRKYVNILKKR